MGRFGGVVLEGAQRAQKKRSEIASLFLCPRQDSNLQASQHSHLKRARLPISPLGQHTFSLNWCANIRMFFGTTQILGVFFTFAPPTAYTKALLHSNLHHSDYTRAHAYV